MYSLRLTNFSHIYASDMCTGNFQETDQDLKRYTARPQEGTRCVSPCISEEGRWGTSWCNTVKDGSQWGAECVSCSGKMIYIIRFCICEILLLNTSQFYNSTILTNNNFDHNQFYRAKLKTNSNGFGTISNDNKTW